VGASPSVSSPAPYALPYVGLVALAVAIFLSVTLEMLPLGLLPQMSAELGVSESLIGISVTVYALTVVLSTAVLTAITRRIARHTLVVAVLAVFAVSAFLSAAAPSYELLIASRVLGGLAHGLFWSIVGAYAAYLVPREHVGRAVSITLGGTSLALVMGVPLATALGTALGWRLSFAVLAALTLAGVVVVLVFLPTVGRADTAPGSAPTLGSSAEPPVIGVIVLCVVTALIMVGQYSFYTYFAPFYTREVGVPGSQISGALFVYGAVGAVSLVIVALWLGRRPRASLYAVLSLLLVAIVLLASLPGLLPVAVVATVLWALSIGAVQPLLQTRMLHSTSERTRDTASAFFTTAFNIGIGGGALVGAVALDELGIGSLAWIYAAILAAGIVLVIGSDIVVGRVSEARRPRRP